MGAAEGEAERLAEARWPPSRPTGDGPGLHTVSATPQASATVTSLASPVGTAVIAPSNHYNVARDVWLCGRAKTL